MLLIYMTKKSSTRMKFTTVTMRQNARPRVVERLLKESNELERSIVVVSEFPPCHRDFIARRKPWFTIRLHRDSIILLRGDFTIRLRGDFTILHHKDFISRRFVLGLLGLLEHVSIFPPCNLGRIVSTTQMITLFHCCDVCSSLQEPFVSVVSPKHSC
jgi:hypothetical protein